MRMAAGRRPRYFEHIGLGSSEGMGRCPTDSCAGWRISHISPLKETSTMNQPRLSVAAFLCAVGVASPAAAATYSNLSDFRSAIASAGPGAVILLADGTYSNSSSIVISRQGTASAPIIIAAANIGGATISGSAGITFSSTAAYVEVR